MPSPIAFACAAIVSCHSSLPTCCTPTSLLYAVIGDFPAMERERATRGTNRGSPRGIPRKTRSHQDSWMLALCCIDLTYWPLQLPCTINRDPARSVSYTKEREREREKSEEKVQEGRGDVASHVVARRASSLPPLLSLTVPRVVFVAGLFLFPSLPLASISRSGKGPTVVEMENRLGPRRREKRRRDARAISRRRAHYARFLKPPVFVSTLNIGAGAIHAGILV